MRKLNDARILVTGGSGFIGTNLIFGLIKEGAKIYTISTGNTDHAKPDQSENKINVIKADVRKIPQIKNAVSDVEPEIIYHLAAVLRADAHDMPALLETNVIGTYNILSSLRQSDFSCFINMSTADVYKDSNESITETSPLEPVSLYGSSKISAENLCVNFMKESNYPIISIRAFLAYGRYQLPKFLIPSAIEAALKNQNFKTTFGEQRRDPIFIDDLVNALILVAKKPNCLRETFNLCSGEVLTVRKIVETIFAKSHSKGKPLFGALPYRKYEAWNLVGSNKKLKDATGWTPEFSFEKGIESTIEWYREKLYGS